MPKVGAFPECEVEAFSSIVFYFILELGEAQKTIDYREGEKAQNKRNETRKRQHTKKMNNGDSLAWASLKALFNELP